MKKPLENLDLEESPAKELKGRAGRRPKGCVRRPDCPSTGTPRRLGRTGNPVIARISRRQIVPGYKGLMVFRAVFSHLAPGEFPDQS